MRSGIAFTAFTAQGFALAEALAPSLGASVRPRSQPLRSWAEEAFVSAEALVFIGACGIAVRAVAPLLRSKAEDPAVLVLDEQGRFVVSLLSGHLGGANALAERLAALTGGTPVITTATDVNCCFAVDLWAKRQGMAVLQPGRIKALSAKLLAGGSLTVQCPWPIEGQPPAGVSQGAPGDAVVSVRPEAGSALQLVPKVLVLGVGCRKGVSAGQIEAAFVRFCAERSILPQSVAAAASIDRKQHESGLLSFCAQRELPLHFFPAEALAAVPGSFSASSFVLDTVGVDNVCERSAALLSGGPLLEKKYAENGVSLALALRPPQFNWNWK